MNGRWTRATPVSDELPYRPYGTRPRESGRSGDRVHHPHRGGEDAARGQFPTDRGESGALPHDFVRGHPPRSHPRFPEGAATVPRGSLVKEAGSHT